MEKSIFLSKLSLVVFCVSISGVSVDAMDLERENENVKKFDEVLNKKVSDLGEQQFLEQKKAAVADESLKRILKTLCLKNGRIKWLFIGVSDDFCKDFKILTEEVNKEGQILELIINNAAPEILQKDLKFPKSKEVIDIKEFEKVDFSNPKNREKFLKVWLRKKIKSILEENFDVLMALARMKKIFQKALEQTVLENKALREYVSAVQKKIASGEVVNNEEEANKILKMLEKIKGPCPVKDDLIICAAKWISDLQEGNIGEQVPLISQDDSYAICEEERKKEVEMVYKEFVKKHDWAKNGNAEGVFESLKALHPDFCEEVNASVVSSMRCLAISKEEIILQVKGIGASFQTLLESYVPSGK